MNTRKTSQQKSYRRQLQLESLETRCLLALTAFASVDAGITCELPAPESDTVIVARAIRADATIEIVSDCHCPPDETQSDYSDPAAEGELLECAVDDAIRFVDLSFVADDPSQYIFDFTAVQRTLTDNTDPSDEATSETTDVIVTFSVQPQEGDAGVTDEVSDEIGAEEKPAADGEVESPVIYYMGPMVETTVQPEGKPTEGEGSSGPIVFRPTYDDAGFDVPQGGQEEPGIYTLGGDVTTTNDSHSANSNSDSDGGEHDLSVHLTRQQRRELRAERRAERRAEKVRERNERNLLAAVNDQPNNLPLTTTTTSEDDKPAPTTNQDAKPLGGEVEQAVTQALQPKHRGRRSGGRR